MKPIKTEYNGVTFRSRLEARWAVFFDAMGIHWEYEPSEKTIQTKYGLYTPDFYFSKADTLAEAKPEWPTPLELSFMRVAAKKLHPIILLIGPPSTRYFWMLTHGKNGMDEKAVFVKWNGDANGWYEHADAALAGVEYNLPYNESLRYIDAVNKALSYRFDGFDEDRARIRERYA